jgi:mRNA-degrading endonuclease toxin of MazEF toxin-antitoxin module
MQFEVFANPLVGARGAYPYVVVLQADIAAAGRERVVAFLAPHGAVGHVAGRLMPVVTLGKRPFVVLMPSITTVPVSALREPVGDLRAFRESILEAVNATFLGS